MSSAQATQQNNRSGDGKYATKTHDEANSVDLAAVDYGPKPVGDHWYMIERQYGPDLVVGPYVTAEEAESAMNDSVLADSFCEEDCTDAYTTTEADRPRDDVEIVYIDRDEDASFGDVRVPADQIPAEAKVHDWENDD